ncbi:unnamed protein product, partial [Pelagomonas calceolata]
MYLRTIGAVGAATALAAAMAVRLLLGFSLRALCAAESCSAAVLAARRLWQLASRK